MTFKLALLTCGVFDSFVSLHHVLSLDELPVDLADEDAPAVFVRDEDSLPAHRLRQLQDSVLGDDHLGPLGQPLDQIAVALLATRVLVHALDVSPHMVRSRKSFTAKLKAKKSWFFLHFQ